MELEGKFQNNLLPAAMFALVCLLVVYMSYMAQKRLNDTVMQAFAALEDDADFATFTQYDFEKDEVVQGQLLRRSISTAGGAASVSGRRPTTPN